MSRLSRISQPVVPGTASGGGTVQKSVPSTSPTAALDASVLVLNRSYMPVHVVGVRRAIGLLLAELAEAIDNEDGFFANYDFEAWRLLSEMRALKKKPLDDWIRSVNFELQVPRVLRLQSFDRIPRTTLHPSRRSRV